MSDLNINLSKNEIFQVGGIVMSRIWLGFWTTNCDISLHLLGLALGTSYKSKVIWDPVVKRILVRLESWKAPPLSEGGRLTLSHLLWLPFHFFISFHDSNVSR